MDLKTIQKKLYKLSLALFVLLIFSFLPFFNSSNKVKSVDSAIINPKNKNSVEQILLYGKTGTKAVASTPEIIEAEKSRLILKKQGDFWFLSFNDNFIPLNQIQVKSFLEELCKIQKFYKISDSKKALKALSLEESDSADFCIQLSQNSVLFNLSGKTENKVYIRSTVSDKVFEIQNSKLVLFLNSDVNFWAESSIIPQSVFSNNNIQSIRIIKNGKQTVYDDKSTIKKLLSLTHGKIQNSMPIPSDELEDHFQNAETLNHLQKPKHFQEQFFEQTTIFADFGDGSEIKIHAKPLTDESYVLTYAFFPANQIEKPVREIIQRFNYSVIVSSWTMNNFTGE